MNTVNNLRCTFCESVNETIVQIALIGVCNNHLDKRMILMNHLILIFRKSLFEIRDRNLSPTIHYIKYRIKNIMKIEYKIAQYNIKQGRL